MLWVAGIFLPFCGKSFEYLYSENFSDVIFLYFYLISFFSFLEFLGIVKPLYS